MKQRNVLLLLLFVISCAHHAAVPTLFDTQKRIDDYIDSGKYEADCAQVANQARNYLEQRVKKGEKLAIVLDIDETSLSNWPAYRINHWARILTGECDLQKGPCNIQKYQAMAQAKAIAPTLALANFARENHVAVFFVTGRGEDLRQATEKNLSDAGYQWDGLILKIAGKTYPSAVDFKAPARKQIMQQGYTIIFTMGDQWSDLSGGYAERSFKLPNPVYYLP
jgi:predicted secreted acid phosphatase